MFFIFLLIFFSPLFLQAKISLSAGVRESYITSLNHTFGGDGMARVKRKIFDMGFNSVTAHIRLGMKTSTSSEVYDPPLRSKQSDLENLSSRIVHAQGNLTLRPTIYLQPDLGVAKELSNINPINPTLWLAHYRKSMLLYVSLASRNEITELVLGVGLANLWKPEFGSWWAEFTDEARRIVGKKTRLSIEITSESDIIQITNWKNENPDQFKKWLENLDRIRFSDKLTKNEFTTTLEKLIARFPNKDFTLANITIPACENFIYEGTQAFCQNNDKVSFKLQIDRLKTWFDAFLKIPSSLQNKIVELEFFTSTTDSEPIESEKDYSALILNPDLQKISLPKLACIYYDESKSNPIHSNLQSILLENLIGAFPSWTAERRSVDFFKKNELTSCQSVFYLATDYFFQPNTSFLEELVEYQLKQPVVWINYKIDKFIETYNYLKPTLNLSPLGFSFLFIDQDESPPANISEPNFFKHFDYKGETFFKLAGWQSGKKYFIDNTETHLIKVTDPINVKILSWARHTDNRRKTPYLIRRDYESNGSFFYFADSPFSYIHYEDRYLIFTDILWDVLKEPPPSGKPVALVRLEDINPSMEIKNMQWIIDYLADQKIPFSMAVIPYYSRLFADEDNKKPERHPIYKFPDFWGLLKYANARDADFIFHGVSHQAGDLIGGYDGKSGSDYEFWLYPENQPLPYDSSDFILNLLSQGEEVFQRLGVRPIAWETPHYASSALDSFFFGKLFKWNYHRPIYFVHKVINKLNLKDRHLLFDCLTLECRQERRRLSQEFKLNIPSLEFVNQIFPYPIYQDVYGQSIIPETLGYIDYTDYRKNTKTDVTTPADIIRRAKKLKVIRGAMASFFWHSDLLSKNLPYYLENPDHYKEMNDGKRTITDILDGLIKLGYEFKSISDCSLFPQKGCKNPHKNYYPLKQKNKKGA